VASIFLHCFRVCHPDPALWEKHLALLFVGGKVQSEILRSAALSRNSMNYSFRLSNLGRADQKAFCLLFAPLQHPRHGPSLIPAGDQYSSRGQRPRNTYRSQGATLKGSNAAGVTPVLRPGAQANTTLPGSGNEPRAFRGRCPRLLSCALAGHEEAALRTHPVVPVSDITDSGFRLSSLRMTAW
jgi:hypothetical protein